MTCIYTLPIKTLQWNVSQYLKNLWSEGVCLDKIGFVDKNVILQT